MSQTADLSTYFKRIFGTPGGRKVISDLERKADDRDTTIAARHAAVARIAEADRVAREEVPVAKAEVAKAGAALAVARAAYEKADRLHYEAGIAESRLCDRARQDRRRAEGELRLSADPRLAGVRQLLLEAGHQWPHAANAMAKFELRGEFLEAHQFITNREELDQMRLRIDRALERVETLRLVADPSEEEILAVLREGEAAAAPVLGTVRRFFT